MLKKAATGATSDSTTIDFPGGDLEEACLSFESSIALALSGSRSKTKSAFLMTFGRRK
jgi:hypothetical protein